METEIEPGICPSCERRGWIGQPCTDDRCRRRGYHLIPHDNFEPGARRPDPLIGQLWDGYLLTRRLGEGGVGAVYLALQQPVGLRTALKVLHARRSGTSALAERFASEASALARLVHPNIVRLLGAGSVDDCPYIAMEYIEGARTLQHEMRAGIDLDAARRILLQIVDALDSAHRVNIIHRDIKPANVMLQSTGREPYFVRIVDFGLAKFTDDGASTQLAAGTPIYMAPEQVRRINIGPWTDWYAVGVLGLELIAGRRPFPNVASHVLLQLKVVGEADLFEPMADLDLPDAVHVFASRATAAEPTARPQTAGEMIELIEWAFAALRERSAHPAPLAAPRLGLAPDSGISSVSLSGAAGEVVAEPAPSGSRRGVAIGAVAATLCLGGLVWWSVAGTGGDERVYEPSPPAIEAVASGVDAMVAAAPSIDATVPDGSLERGVADASPVDAAIVDAARAHREPTRPVRQARRAASKRRPRTTVKTGAGAPAGKRTPSQTRPASSPVPGKAPSAPVSPSLQIEEL